MPLISVFHFHFHFEFHFFLFWFHVCFVASDLAIMLILFAIGLCVCVCVCLGMCVSVLSSVFDTPNILKLLQNICNTAVDIYALFILFTIHLTYFMLLIYGIWIHSAEGVCVWVCVFVFAWYLY